MTLEQCIRKIITTQFKYGDFFDTHAVIELIQMAMRGTTPDGTSFRPVQLLLLLKRMNSMLSLKAMVLTRLTLSRLFAN